MSRYALTEEIERLLGQPITERGQNVSLRCPFHEDRGAPNLSIDLETGLWMCFRDGYKGNIFTLARMLDQDISQTDVILATYMQSTPTNIEPPDFSEKALFYHENAKLERPSGISRFLGSRGISSKAFHHFRIGWTPQGAIALPYYDDDRVVAIKYRGTNGKKWGEAGSVQALYNIDDVRGAATVILAEGETDTQAIWSWLDRSMKRWHNVRVAGVPGVGPNKPSRSTWELWALEFGWAKRVYIAFDADEAGDIGAEGPMGILGEKAVRLRPTEGKDWAESLMDGEGLDTAIELAG